MKIVQIIPTLNSGGAEKLVTDMSIMLKEMGINIEVYSLFNNKNSKFESDIVNNGIKVSSFNKRLGFDLICMIKIFNKLRHDKIDIIHCHLDSIKYVSLPAFILNIPVVYTFHNIANKDAQGINSKVLNLIFKYLKVQPVAICEKVKQTAIELYGKSMVDIPVIYNGIDINKIENVISKREKGLNFLNVATFKEQKNHKFLIDVMERVINWNKHIKLYLVGDGPLRKQIEEYVNEKQLEDNIIFLGDRNDIFYLMKKYNYFILLSKYEGFSIAILEAMACKMKILVSDVGGNSEQIDNNINGIIVEKNDINLCFEEIKNIINNNENYGENAYKKVKSKFNISKTCYDYYELYKLIKFRRVNNG